MAAAGVAGALRALSPAFPTYGHLLRAAGYRTPMAGDGLDDGAPGTDGPQSLEAYGFERLRPEAVDIASVLLPTTGTSTGGPVDAAALAADWLRRHADGDGPWCLTVSLRNAHDPGPDGSLPGRRHTAGPPGGGADSGECSDRDASAGWPHPADIGALNLAWLDAQIGQVLSALSPRDAASTVVLFAADQGIRPATETASADFDARPWHVPLIVADGTGAFVAQAGQPRVGLVSSVDLLRLLVSLGHRGGSDWLAGPATPRGEAGEAAQLYGRRLDLLPALRAAQAPGRPQLLLAHDDLPAEAGDGGAPPHLLGLLTPQALLGTRTHWSPGGVLPMRATRAVSLRATAPPTDLSDSPFALPAAAAAISVFFLSTQAVYSASGTARTTTGMKP